MYFVAEIGSNWKGGSEAESYKLVIDAINQGNEAGAQAVKFQLWQADRLYSQLRAPEAHKKVKQYEFPRAWLEEVEQRVHRHNLDLWLSVFDAESAQIACAYADFVKIASGDLTNDTLIRETCIACSATGTRLAISTGAATEEEVSDTLSLIANWGDVLEDLILMHCVSAYPAPAHEYNIQVVQRMATQDMRDYFGYNAVGLSDHTVPGHHLTAQLALACGATVFERHMRPYSAYQNPDYPHSLTPVQFAEYIRTLTLAQSILGDGRKRPAPSEIGERIGARRGPDGLRPALSDGVTA